MGEASSLYLWSPQAPGAIAQAQPGARIIAILREPASFLRSLHLQLLQNHIETQKSLRKAISLEAARRQGRRVPRRSPQPPALQYSERVRYVEQLRRYHDAFPQEQVLVLIYDDFRRDNEGTIRQVQRFLAVDDTLPIEATEANRTVLVRSQQLDDLVHAVSVGRGPVATVAKATVKAFTPQTVAQQCAAGSAAHDRPRRCAAARRGPDVGAAPALQARGGGVERVSGPRPGGVVGL